MINITFFGAAHEVTGSCHLLEIGSKKVLFDCGMFQGGDFNEGKNHDRFPFDPKEIDAVIVSHAHTDHTGRIPKLVREGFRGPIYMTKATCDLAKIIWDDAYNIMVYDHKKFQSPILFDESDIELAAAQCRGLDYYEKVDLGDGISFVLKDAGHIFGAAFIELTAEDKTICYSGDIGNDSVPILRDTDQLGEVDLLLCESTYGDRIHESDEERKKILLDIVKEGSVRGGVIMMPAFSVERTQEIIYMLEELIAADKFMRDGDRFLSFDNLFLTETMEESKKINHVPCPKMIIAGAGMMNGGRILHHAKRYLSDPNSMLVIVGYQAQGTVGRKLYEGAEYVTIHNEEVPVRATVRAVGAFSAHADQKKLLSWV